MGFLEDARRKKTAEAQAFARAESLKGKPSPEDQGRLIAEYDKKCEIDYNLAIANMNSSPFPRLADEFRIVAFGLIKEVTPRFTSSLDTSLFDYNHVDYPGQKRSRRYAVCLELKWDYSNSNGTATGTYKEIDIFFYADGKIIVKGNENGETIMVREEWHQRPENAEAALEKAFKNPNRNGADPSRSGYSNNSDGPGMGIG